MDKLLGLSDNDRRRLFEEAEAATRIKAHMVEKDFWVCWTLRHLFGLPGAKDHFIFKGGTSLSRVWRVIHRFSEDIDISLSREWLGFGGERDPEAAPTRKQRKIQLEALSAACAKRLKMEVAPALLEAFSGVLGRGSWTLESDPDDAQTLLFAYPSVFGDPIAGMYVRPVVRIECGARSDRWPVAEGVVTPYVAEAFPEALSDGASTLPVLSIERTFWEKASILHAEAHRPQEKAVPERYSRHYADMAALAQSAYCARALELDDLRARVIAHKMVFFPAAWAHSETAVRGTFRLIPPADRREVLSRDYAAMRDMFFREPLPWNEILDVLVDLERRINSP